MYSDHTHDLLRRLLDPNLSPTDQLPQDHLIWVNGLAHLRSGAVSMGERELATRRREGARTELERLTA